MTSAVRIPLQKLFFLAVVLKVGTAYLGWHLQMPWSLGFGVPLAIMGLYIILGHHRADDDVPDEKFADTCYYLGFIFTITSIIFSLFDLPNIGTRLQDIAVRFGAAMVSTVLGLAVRVYLVSFKKDGADAIEEAEDAVIQASQRFREQLVMAFEKLRDFEDAVDKAAMNSVERVNLQVEKLSQDHSTRLAAFFEELAKQNQLAFTTALEEVKGASLRLSTSVDRYSLGIQRNLGSIEEKVTRFGDAVTERLQNTTFPDDYFSRNLAQPVELLQNASREVASQVLHASEQVSESTVVLSAALRKLKTKATSAEESLEVVTRLTAAQHSVLEAAQGQLQGLQELHGTLTRFDGLLNVLADGLARNTATAMTLSEKVESVVVDGSETREQMKGVLSALNERVAASALVVQSLGDKLEKNGTTNDAVANQLGLAAVSTSRVAAKLDAIAATEEQTAQHLAVVAAKADSTTAEVVSVVRQLQDMVRQLTQAAASLSAGQVAGNHPQPKLAVDRHPGTQADAPALSGTLQNGTDLAIPVLVPSSVPVAASSDQADLSASSTAPQILASSLPSAAAAASPANLLPAQPAIPGEPSIRN
jgi:methyl-accepting chemotaxis protein